MFDQWFSFIPACMNTDIRKLGAVSIAENWQNAVTSKMRWSGFSQNKNMTTERQLWTKILPVSLAAPLQKDAAKLLRSFESMNSLGGWDGVRRWKGERSHDLSCCQVSHARWSRSRWDWFCQKGSEVALKSELPLAERLMSGI